TAAGSTTLCASLAGPGAQDPLRAARAVRLARGTDAPPVDDEQVGRLRPPRPRDEGAEIVVDLLRVLRPREAQPLRHSGHMGVHCSARDAVGVTLVDVDCLS